MNPNFGEELTLYQCLEILRETNPSNLPERAKFWEIHYDEIQEHLLQGKEEIVIDDTKFRITYYAKLSVYEPFLFGKGLAWIRIGENGADPQSFNRDNDDTNDEGNPDI
jgi:hypothetical protein